MRTLAAAVCLALLWATSAAAAIPGRHDEPLAFAPVQVAGPRPAERLGQPSLGPGRRSAEVPSVRELPRAVAASRPSVRLPANPPRVVARNNVRPGNQASVQQLAGTASWYCGHGSACTRGYPGGLYAAAGPALRVGDWRGRVVTVTAGSSSVRVRLIDWCACPNGRLLDLYSTAFSRLAPLSRGLVKVTVTW